MSRVNTLNTFENIKSIRSEIMPKYRRKHIFRYTKGSVDFFSTYPGLYVPRPLGFRCDQVAATPPYLAQEILALTKMNWNNTRFDGGQPITLHCARQVGQILKYFGPNDHYEPYYRFYM